MLGDTVWPDKVASREIPAASQSEALVLRERLLRALEGDARKAAPVEAATAQINFDCWLDELEEVSDPDAYRKLLARLLAEVRIWPLDSRDARRYAEIYHRSGSKISAHASTSSLALCIAILRARSAG